MDSLLSGWESSAIYRDIIALTEITTALASRAIAAVALSIVYIPTAEATPKSLGMMFIITQLLTSYRLMH